MQNILETQVIRFLNSGHSFRTFDLNTVRMAGLI